MHSLLWGIVCILTDCVSVQKVPKNVNSASREMLRIMNFVGMHIYNRCFIENNSTCCVQSLWHTPKVE